MLGFVPAAWLALSGGGYDIVLRSEIGIAAWWTVLLGALVGVLPRRRLSGAGRAALLLFGLLLLWTWIVAGWSPSEEQALAELARVSAYGGALAAALALLTWRTRGALVDGVTCAVAVVTVLAVLSRLLPSLFGSDPAALLYAPPGLRYPFDYPDAVGELAALGIPLLLRLVASARSALARLLAAAVLPFSAACIMLTSSRGGVLAAGVGLLAFVLLCPDRFRVLARTLLAAAIAAVVIAEAQHLAALREATGVAPASQRVAMLAVLLLSAAASALAQAGFSVLARRRGEDFLRPERQTASRIGLGAAVLLVTAVLAVVFSGAGSDLWRQFKTPSPIPAGRLTLAGSNRYDYWRAAFHALQQAPWKGGGPGSFSSWWLTHDTLSAPATSAHSLWADALVATGIPGAALLLGIFGLLLAAGIRRARASPVTGRAAAAAATAGIAAFCAAAAVDWIWQFGAVVLVALLLGAVAVGPLDPKAQERADRRRARDRDWSDVRWPPRSGRDREPARRRPPSWTSRVLLALAAAAALWAILVPLVMTVEVRRSQAAARRGDFAAAISAAATAQRIEPGAAAPRLQRALLLELIGDPAGARRAIGQAIARGGGDWRVWMVASRIDIELDHPRTAVADYVRARSLDPTSWVFSG